MSSLASAGLFIHILSTPLLYSLVPMFSVIFLMDYICRPLSKTVRFNVLKVIPAGSSTAGKKAFTGI